MSAGSSAPRESGLCSDERFLASALRAIEVLQSYQQSDARLLLELNARQRENARMLAEIRTYLANRLRPANP